MHYPSDRITHTTAFDTPVVEHWLEREIAQWVAFKEKNLGVQGYQWRSRGIAARGQIYMGAPIGVQEIHLQLEIVVSIEV